MTDTAQREGHIIRQCSDNPEVEIYTLESLPSSLQNTQDHLTNTRRQLEEAKAAVDKPFPYEEDLTTKSARLAELNALLDMDRPENTIVDDDLSEDNHTPSPDSRLER